MAPSALSEEHELPGTPVCHQINGITGPDNVPLVEFGDTWAMAADGSNTLLVFDTMAEARAYMQTQDYQDMKRMLSSLSLKPSETVVVLYLTRSQAAKVQFDLPTGWTAAEVPAGTATSRPRGLTSRTSPVRGSPSLYYGSGGGLGGACGPSERYKVTELDSFAMGYSWAEAAGPGSHTACWTRPRWAKA